MRRSKFSGMAIVELLIACAILMIMSALFFKGVVPVLKRSDWLADSQTSQQFAIITKERLDLELDGVLLVNPLPGDNLSTPPNTGPPLLAQWSLEYHRPQEVPTAQAGTLSELTLLESVSYVDTESHFVIFKDGLLSISHPSPATASAPIWKLGLGSQSNVTRSLDGNILRFEFVGPPDLRYQKASKFKYEFSVVVL